MKKKLLFIILTWITVTSQSFATELSLRPRFNTGFQFYEYTQEAFSFSKGLSSNSTSEINFSDFVPFVSGGLTFFVDRFFVDAFVQYSFEGQDSSRIVNNNRIPAIDGIPASSIKSTVNVNPTFDRLEFSFSVGYAVTDQFVVYAGYKNANTQLHTAMTKSRISAVTDTGAPNPLLNGTLSGNLNLDYKYDGAFIGGTYSFNFDQGFLKGALTTNIAIAFMNGTVDVEYNDIRIKNEAGSTFNVNKNLIDTIYDVPRLEGDTVGVSAGLSWNGLTTIDGLTYLVGINGYHYAFDGSKNSPDFSETVVRVDFGIAYNF